jgi:DNA-binding transcriptional LysR family regulator
MPRTNLDDLNAFLAVAKERSFTRAAAKLGVSQSALSHTIRGLESRLGLRLLTRTTRSVSPTETGERLLRSIGPRLDEIDAELEAVSALRDKPIGTIRLTAGEHSARSILWPRLSKVLPRSDWCPKFAGYHLYYPSRRQQTPAFSVVVDALRYRPPR